MIIPGGYMKKLFLVLSAIVFCLFLTGTYRALAQDVEQEAVTSEANRKQVLDSGKQQIQAQRQEISQNAQAARAEEDQLKQQIKAALDSGDTQTAQQLREKLKFVHQENLQGKMQDEQEMQAAKQDFKDSVTEAHQEGYLHPKIDKDNNPPGPKGGPGTNWENPPGPKGGAGASPNRKVKK
jgi:Mg-chelatase subunit ChlI